MNPLRLQAIIRKEFYHLIRDYRSLYLAFAIPLILIILFGYALNLDVNNVETVVIDHDKTELSRDFLSKISASPYFHVAANLPDAKQAADYLDSNLTMVAIVIPPGFMNDIRADRTASLQIIIDGSDPNFAGIIRGYLTAITEQYNQKLLVNYLNRQGLAKINAPVDGRIASGSTKIWKAATSLSPGLLPLS